MNKLKERISPFNPIDLLIILSMAYSATIIMTETDKWLKPLSEAAEFTLSVIIKIIVLYLISKAINRLIN